MQSKANEFEQQLTEQERAAVSPGSTNEGAEPTESAKNSDFKIAGDKVFVLSAGEANQYYASNGDRAKGGYWWLRSAGVDDYYAAIVDDYGNVGSDG